VRLKTTEHDRVRATNDTTLKDSGYTKTVHDKRSGFKDKRNDVEDSMQTAGRNEGCTTDSMSLSTVNDLGASWRDGVLLCRLVAVLCGCTTDVHRLNPVQRLRNCRLALQVASRYLQLPPVSLLIIGVPGFSLMGALSPLSLDQKSDDLNYLLYISSAGAAPHQIQPHFLLHSNKNTQRKRKFFRRPGGAPTPPALPGYAYAIHQPFSPIICRHFTRS